MFQQSSVEKDMAMHIKKAQRPNSKHDKFCAYLPIMTETLKVWIYNGIHG